VYLMKRAPQEKRLVSEAVEVAGSLQEFYLVKVVPSGTRLRICFKRLEFLRSGNAAIRDLWSLNHI
jgi:hypothetical protein